MKKTVNHQNNGAFWHFVQQCLRSWIFMKHNKLLRSVYFNPETFRVTNFGLVLYVGKIKAMVFIPKKCKLFRIRYWELLKIKIMFSLKLLKTILQTGDTESLDRFGLVGLGWVGSSWVRFAWDGSVGGGGRCSIQNTTIC